MMPSTGYFKGINCPFYDNGLCERPYCHYRHYKKDSSVSTPNDGIESGAILQILVSAAVQKVLQNTETSTSTSTQMTVVESGSGACKVSSAPSKVTYNPTPIAELNKMGTPDAEDIDDTAEQRKKHIPVPYTPRKPASLPIKRSLESSSKPFIYNPPPLKYTPGCPESTEVDLYTPKGTTESSEKYLPGTEAQLQEYTPKNETQTVTKHNYVPSDKSVSKKKVLEYKPVKVSNKTVTPIYQPTPKALVPCFSSDEEEPETKKPKHLNDLNGLDDLGPEFDILDQILDDEQPQQMSKTNKENSSSRQVNETNVTSSKNHDDDSRKYKSSSEKHENKKSQDTTKKEKSSSHSKCDKSNNKINDSCHESHKKSVKDRHKDRKKVKKNKSSEERKDKSTEDKRYKSTEVKKNKSTKERKDKSTEDKRDKSTEEKKEKSSDEKKVKYTEEKKDKSTDKKKHSSSRSSEKSSKNTENGSSKTSDKHSKHSNSSKSRSDSKEQRKRDHHRSSRKSKGKETSNNENITDTDHNFDDTAFTLVNEDELLDLSESDEDAIALECKRIFDEYVPTEKTITNEEEVTNNNLEDDSDKTEYVPVKKRISRTIDKNIKVIPKAPLKPNFKVSAAQAMAARLEKIKEFHASRNSHESSSNESVQLRQEVPKPSVSTPNIASNKVRIAHVPYASTLMIAKRTIPVKPKSDEPSTSSTIVQTNKKAAQRVAHIPNEKFIDRPGVLEPLASKIAANIRSTYLNMMIDECLKIYLSATDAYARAQHEELATSKKCSTVQIYKNSAVLTVSRLRKEFQECNGVKKSGSDCSTLQKMPQSNLGNTSNVGSWSIVSKNKRLSDYSNELSGPKFYRNISKWVLNEEQLIENGFPRPHASGEKGRAVIHGQNKLPPPKGLIRTCCRCKKDYSVDKKGFPVGNEECIYHPKNKYKVRGEAKYQCCSQDNTSDGCCIASCHVYEFVDFENLKGYIKTMPPDYVLDDYGVYALDCEMCYTTHGLDLTRVTVINSSCKVVYETLIKPLHPIIDYNTRYSGITEEQMANVRTTLLEVQATLLTMFNSKTILVGHSLESDFKALKLIHDTVIDTSVLFPHKMGPPFKRALRNLSSEYLKKIIQNSVEGHDSAEDATVCMELLIYKLKEDLKTR